MPARAPNGEICLKELKIGGRARAENPLIPPLAPRGRASCTSRQFEQLVAPRNALFHGM